MKKIIIVVALFQVILSYAQEIVTINHTYYTTQFNKIQHIPWLVEYTLTKEMLTCRTAIARSNKFTPDPKLSKETDLNEDYKGSHYDRGHNMSAQDNRCNKTGMSECFYFSNMFPQTHSLNAGVWKSLETLERKLAMQYGDVRVSIGSIGRIKTIGDDKVVVPQYCWKAIYIPSTKQYLCYIFPNIKIKIKDKKLENYVKDRSDIESRCDVEFKNGFAISK